MVLIKYSNFVDVFFKKFMIVLFEYFITNKYSINLELRKQPLYKPIYSLRKVKLKTLQTYIETNLAKGFL